MAERDKLVDQKLANKLILINILIAVVPLLLVSGLLLFFSYTKKGISPTAKELAIFKQRKDELKKDAINGNEL